MSVNAENNADGPAARDSEGEEAIVNGLSPDLIEQSIKANL